jgi:hypothetical protein
MHRIDAGRMFNRRNDPADRRPESPKTTTLYDRTSDQITLDEGKGSEFEQPVWPPRRWL